MKKGFKYYKKPGKEKAMKVEVFNYYINDLSNKNLVFKFMKGECLGSILPAIISFYYLVCFFKTVKVLAGLSFLVFYILFLSIFNYSAKRVLFQRYKIVSKNFLWCDCNYSKLKQEKLVDFLEKKNLYSEKKIKDLIEICLKESARRRGSYFFNWSLFLAVLVPLWVQFLGSVFKLVNNDLNRAVLLFFSFLIIITGIVFLISSLGILLTELDEVLFNRESNELKNLTYHLENILLEFDVASNE